MTSIDATELATWTPVSLNLEEPTPSIDWGDVGSLRFTGPIFDDTLAAWAAQDPLPPMVRTGLEALAVLDQAPSLDPGGLIFHLSRCGSTLLARLLRQVPGCLVVSEPEPVNSLLIADPSIMDEDTQVHLLRLLIRALGRRRFEDERNYVVKLTSWNVRKLDLFRLAFPDARLVWLQRDPAEVILSMLTRAPQWLHLLDEPGTAGRLFDVAAQELPTLEPEALYARALAPLLRAAHDAGARLMPVVDYADLPGAAWTTIAPLFGLAADGEVVARMQAEARYYAKDPSPRLYTPVQSEVPEPVRRVAAEHLAALYGELSRRKASTAGLHRSGASQA
jgi:hypothetical protein